MSTSLPTPPPPWGVCLSGGGIRSASFCLGALQAMQQFDPDFPLIQGPAGRPGHAGTAEPPYVPGRATFITSVSGGSYMASALIFVAQGAVNGEPDFPQLVLSKRDNSTTKREVKTVAVAPDEAFAAGSPEERYLRDHTRYLSHGFGGPLAMIWQLLISIGLNLILLSLAVMMAALPIGWLYGHLIPVLQSGSQGIYRFTFSNAGWPLVPGIAGGASLILAFFWVVAVTPNPGVNKVLLATSLGLAGVVLGWLCFAVGLPVVLEWLHRSVGTTAGATVATPSNTTKSLGAAAGAGTAASVLVALLGTRVARTVEAGWDEVPLGIRRPLVQKGKSLLLKFRAPLINVLISLIGPFTLLCLFLLGVHVGALYPAWARPGRNWDPFVGALCALAFLVLMYICANVTNWSLHPFYRERLADAFCLKRFELADATDIAVVREDKRTRNTTWLPTEVRGQFADHRPYSFGYGISAVQPESMPKLIVCASANVSTYGATPTGFRATSFVFSGDKIGGGLLGDKDAASYEAVVSGFATLKSTVSLPAAVAISGAAVSPEMGRATRAPLRFLLTLANVRLGVWIPNPLRLAWFEQQLTKGRLRRSLVKPRLEHLLYEMFGKNKLTHKYLYVTDGGHYENLGLLEQLRMGSRYIFCLDASGEQQGGFSTIAAAVSLAFSEEQIRIDVHPEVMAPKADVTAERAGEHLPPVVSSTFCVGNIYYPGDGDEPSGRLVIIKAGVPLDAPENISDFHQSNWKFPCDPTLDQLYTADRFDAYKALGSFAAGQALRYVRDDFDVFRQTGRLRPWTDDSFGPPAT